MLDWSANATTLSKKMIISMVFFHFCSDRFRRLGFVEHQSHVIKVYYQYIDVAVASVMNFCLRMLIKLAKDTCGLLLHNDPISQSHDERMTSPVLIFWLLLLMRSLICLWYFCYFSTIRPGQIIDFFRPCQPRFWQKNPSIRTIINLTYRHYKIYA